jgi:subtilisin family serine protease
MKTKNIFQIKIAAAFILFAIFSCADAQIELKLGGEKVRLKRVVNETALVYSSNDTTIVTDLMRQGIFIDERVNKNAPGNENEYVLFSLNASEKKKFVRAVESFNTRNINDVNVAPVFEYDNSLNILTDEFILKFKDHISEAAKRTFLAANKMEIINTDPYVPGQYLIRYTDVSPEVALNRLSAYDSSIIKFIEPNFIQIIKTRPSAENPNVVPQQVLAPSSGTPNDSLLNFQWYLHNRGTPSGRAGADIKGVTSWDISRGSEEIIIAVLDEGVDTGHRDLRNKIVKPYDAVGDDAIQDPQPKAGHGTACAGIAAAATHNLSGISGIGWNCKIMPVRIAEINPENRWVTSSQIIARGIRRAAEQGAHVLSCSWGGGVPSTAVNDAIDFAISKNCILVFAAGNNNGPVSYPAKLSLQKNVVAVSATNEWDESKSPTTQDRENWWGTNFGPEVTVAAPGVHICTTDISGPGRGYDTNSDYIFNFNGTSSATPLVAGAMAMLTTKESQVSMYVSDTED